MPPAAAAPYGAVEQPAARRLSRLAGPGEDGHHRPEGNRQQANQEMDDRDPVEFLGPPIGRRALDQQRQGDHRGQSQGMPEIAACLLAAGADPADGERSEEHGDHH